MLLFGEGCSNLFQKQSGKTPLDKQREVSEQMANEVASGKTMLVGDYVSFGNVHPVQLQGVGLVQRLAGTGADDVNSLERQMVYNEMTKMGVHDVRAILAHPSTAVVNITGYVRPGIQENELFDVEVMLPNGTDAKSLRGGWLMRSPLTEMAVLGGGLRKGDTLAFAEGPIMIDDPLATEMVNPTGLKKGIVLSGARIRESRLITLNMKTGLESAFLTDRISKEINKRFYLASGQKKGVATAKNDSLILLEVHPNYYDDISRYIRIVQSIACYETPEKQSRRIEQLKEDLRNPTKAQNASFQLEAMGKVGIEPLRSALSSRNSEIRFHAATSLAYLGDGTPAAILAQLARDEPAFRVYALNALSVMRNDIEAETYLQELLHVSSAETRYGAFRALRLRNPADRTIRGENLGNQFGYHVITTSGPPMVHLTRSKRPEVVLFGSNISLVQPFALQAGPFIFVNGQQVPQQTGQQV
ncbi:MAG: flagellar basal body P-ring protein FlgI, partial [Thermoguttaceae bacterium]